MIMIFVLVIVQIVTIVGNQTAFICEIIVGRGGDADGAQYRFGCFDWKTLLAARRRRVDTRIRRAKLIETSGIAAASRIVRRHLPGTGRRM